MAEELFGTTADELHEIDAKNEESDDDDDDDDDDEIDFNLVAKKVLNDSIDELIEGLLKTTDDAKITEKPTHVILLKLMEKRKK